MERKNIVTAQGNAVTLLGAELKVGDKAPDFNVLDNEKNYLFNYSLISLAMLFAATSPTVFSLNSPSS